MVEAAAVCPTDVIVPVVLLSRIMGPQLKSASGTVWDPDSTGLVSKKCWVLESMGAIKEADNDEQTDSRLQARPCADRAMRR